VKALQSAELPGWMSDNQEKFQNACQELEKAVQNLKDLEKDSQDSDWENEIEKVHDSYVSLAATME
jgi:hypothetical protein